MSDVFETLARELGGLLSRHEAIPLDGVPVHATLSPGDGEALAGCVAAIGRAGLALVPTGAGGRLDLGNPPARVDVFLSTLGLSGVVDFAPAEGVCLARAGTRLAQLRDTVAAEGWELPLDGPGDATLGGTLAAAAVGPRTQGLGPARDAVLGLEVVLGSGERTRCGGRVVKNVTGYDLAKLYTGSLGCLCVIESAWLRLRPRAQTRRVVARPVRDLAEGVERGLRAARRPTARACALLAGGELVVELAGDAAGVADDAEAIGGDPQDEGRIDAIAAGQWGGGAPVGVRYRIAALPSELPAVLDPLLRAPAEVLVYPGLGLVYVAAAEAEALDVPIREAAGAASGPLRCEAAPLHVKRRGDVFHAPEPEVRLFRALKQRFDPHTALSPGRLAGCL